MDWNAEGPAPWPSRIQVRADDGPLMLMRTPTGLVLVLAPASRTTARPASV